MVCVSFRLFYFIKENLNYLNLFIQLMVTVGLIFYSTIFLELLLIRDSLINFP